MDPAFGLSSLKDRVGSVLHQFVQLPIRISARENFVLCFKMLRSVARLRLIGPKPSLTLLVNKLGECGKIVRADDAIHVSLPLATISSSAPNEPPRLSRRLPYVKRSHDEQYKEQVFTLVSRPRGADGG
jgi:hypothetical protein